MVHQARSIFSLWAVALVIWTIWGGFVATVASDRGEGSVGYDPRIVLSENRPLLPPPPDEAADPEPVRRTETARFFRHRDGKRTIGQFFTRPVHYRDETGAWREIDVVLEPFPAGAWAYRMDKAPYRVVYAADAWRGGDVAQVGTDDVLFALRSLAAAGSRPVGRPSGEGRNELRYADAFAPGLDLELTAAPDRWIKDVVIRDWAAVERIAREPSVYARVRDGALEIAFPIRLSGNLDVEIDGAVRDLAAPVETHGAAIFRDRKTGAERFRMLPARALGRTLSGALPTGRDACSIPVRFECRDDGLVLVKRIPLDWLGGARFPVRADATLSFFPALDGMCYRYSSSDTYATIRSDTDSTWATNWSNPVFVGQNLGGSLISIARIPMRFDTSGIPDGSTLTAATLKLYGTGDGSATDFDVTVTEWTDAADGIDTDDYSAYTSLGAPTQYGTFNSSGWSTGAYNSITISNLTLISDTGTTDYLLRSGNDIGNTAPTQSETVHFSSDNESGTSQDPVLEVTFDPVLEQGAWRWFSDAAAGLTSGDALVPENAVFTSAATSGEKIRLRVRIDEVNGSASSSAAYTIQYSTDDATGWTNITTASSEWRLFNGQGTAGGTVSGSLLLSGSSTAGIYVEDTTSNTNAIAADDEEEMDFALESSGADAAQTYYFRILRGGDEVSTASTPNTHPQVQTQSGSAVLEQGPWRWFTDAAAALTTGDALAAENTTASVSAGTKVRLRVRIDETNNADASISGLLVQHSTDQVSWSYLTTTSAVWQLADGQGTHGSVLSGSLLLTGSTSAGDYVEDTVGIGTTIPANGEMEFDICIQSNGATAGTPYYFRVLRTFTAVPLGASPGTYPSISTTNTQLEQGAWRWFSDGAAEVLVGSHDLAAENTAVTGIAATGGQLRLRVRIDETGGEPLSASAFTLQYSTDDATGWTDIADATSVWELFDGAGTAGNTLTGTMQLSGSPTAGIWVEDTASNTNAIAASGSEEMDFALETDTATAGQTYYFRVLYDGQVIATASTPGTHPQATIANAGSAILNQGGWRWFSDAAAGLTAGDALAAENTAATGITPTGGQVRLRVRIDEINGTASASGNYTIEYSTDDAAWNAITTGSAIWRLFDGAGTAGGAVSGSLLLTGSTTAGIYVEDTTNHANAIASDDEEEMDFALETSAATAGQTYYFRILRDGTEIAKGASPGTHPQITIVSPSLAQGAWRWFSDAAASLTAGDALASENATATGVAATGGRLRLRIRIDETNGGASPSAAYTVQYSKDGSTNWTDVTSSSLVWKFFNGAGTVGGTVSGSLLLAGSSTAGIWVEDTTSNTNAIAADDEEEMDFALETNGAVAGQRYYFRILRGGVPIALGGSPGTYAQAVIFSPTQATWTRSDGTAVGCFAGSVRDGKGARTSVLLLLAFLSLVGGILPLRIPIRRG